MIVEAYLSQPQHKVLEEYYISVLDSLKSQLVYSPVIKNGRDISDVIRGKIMMLEEILQLKNVFDKYDKLKNDVENTGNKGAN